MQRFESPTQCYSQIWSTIHFLFFDSYSKNTLGALTYSRLGYGDVYCMCTACRKVQIESMQTKRPICPSVQQHLVKPTKKRKSLKKRLSERPGRILDKGHVLLWVPNPSSEKFQFSPLTRFTPLQKCFCVVSRIVQKFFFLSLKLSGITVESFMARRSTNLNSEAKQNTR
jgi:hypothetical protein